MAGGGLHFLRTADQNIRLMAYELYGGGYGGLGAHSLTDWSLSMIGQQCYFCCYFSVMVIMSVIL